MEEKLKETSNKTKQTRNIWFYLEQNKKSDPIDNPKQICVSNIIICSFEAMQEC